MSEIDLDGVTITFMISYIRFLSIAFSGMGMVSMAIPIFTSTETGGSGSRVSERTEYYTTAKQLLSSGADAGERLMTAYKVCWNYWLINDAFIN